MGTTVLSVSLCNVFLKNSSNNNKRKMKVKEKKKGEVEAEKKKKTLYMHYILWFTSSNHRR